jgi:hypothetical protein
MISPRGVRPGGQRRTDVCKVWSLLREVWVVVVVDRRVHDRNPLDILIGEANATRQPRLVVLLRRFDQVWIERVVHDALQATYHRVVACAYASSRRLVMLGLNNKHITLVLCKRAGWCAMLLTFSQIVTLALVKHAAEEIKMSTSNLQASKLRPHAHCDMSLHVHHDEGMFCLQTGRHTSGSHFPPSTWLTGIFRMTLYQACCRGQLFGGPPRFLYTASSSHTMPADVQPPKLIDASV